MFHGGRVRSRFPAWFCQNGVSHPTHQHLLQVRRNQQMTTNPPKRQVPKPEKSVIRWLLDSDPSIRWQAMRDLTDAPDKEVAAERAKVATEGWGARLLARQEANGRWGGALDNPEWTCLLSLLWLRHLGLDR